MTDKLMQAVERAKGSVRGLDTDAAGDKYLVWSNEHRAWWRADQCGYTVFVNAAGVYTREEAIQICVGAHNGWQSECAPYEVPVRLSDAIECCERVTRAVVEART